MMFIVTHKHILLVSYPVDVSLHDVSIQITILKTETICVLLLYIILYLVLFFIIFCTDDKFAVCKAV